MGSSTNSTRTVPVALCRGEGLSFPWDRSRYQLLVETRTEIAKSFQMSLTVLLPHPLEQRKDYRLSPHLCRSIHPSPRPCRPFLQIPLQVFHHILSLSKNWAPYRDSQKKRNRHRSICCD